jgi:hypothetical protein
MARNQQEGGNHVSKTVQLAGRVATRRIGDDASGDTGGKAGGKAGRKSRNEKQQRKTKRPR